jgi:hypothetical protein
VALEDVADHAQFQGWGPGSLYVCVLAHLVPETFCHFRVRKNNLLQSSFNQLLILF